MKTRAVYKPTFEQIFCNAIASAKIEGILFDKKAEMLIRKESLKRINRPG